MKKRIVKIFNLVAIFSILFGNFALTMLTYATAENVNSTISLQVSGAELEYNIDSGDTDRYASNIRISINDDNSRYDLKSGQVNFDMDGEEIIGFTSKEAYTYGYTKDGSTVTFNFSTSWDDLITSLEINNIDYTSQVPTTKNDLVSAFSKDSRNIKFDITNVPYASNYEIVISGEKQDEKFMGNFLWTYNENDSTSDDNKIPHGKLEFVSAEYDGTTYDTITSVNAAGNIFQWEDGIKKDSYEQDDRTGIGEAMFPTGTELTLKLIPDTGYQLTSLELNGQPFNAGAEVGTYTFTITGGNFHLGACFTETQNVTKNNSNNIQSGDIAINLDEESSFEHGTAKLEISDITPTTQDDFEAELPDGYEVDNYLDIALYNTIYKGTDDSDSSWDSEVEELENNATVTLELTTDMDEKDIKVIHETHSGTTVTGYEILDTTYNATDNSISFETDGFSNYAIISKNNNDTAYTVEDSDNNSISFNEQDNHTYTFSIIDYMSLSDEQLEALGITRNEYNTLFASIKNITDEYGDIVKIYELNVVDENDNYLHDGPFSIKLKMTEAMKEFNAFKIIFIDVDNGFVSELPIELTVDGEYLTGELEHLSVYAIVGYNETTIDNPQTSDNLPISLLIGAISLIGLVCTELYLHKAKKLN